MKFLETRRLRLAAAAVPFLFRHAETETPQDFYDHTGDFYEKIFAEDKTDDLVFYSAIAGKTGSPVLDVACGNARVLRPLAAAGHTVFGFDKSRKMLQLAAAKCTKLDPEACFRVFLCRASMENIPFRSAFRLAIIPYNSFNHILDPEDQLNCLENIFRALLRGGQLVMEILPYHERYYQGMRLRKAGFIPSLGKTVVVYSRVSHDRKNNRYTVTWYISEKERGIRSKRYISSFTRTDVHVRTVIEMLESLGFEIEDVLTSYPGEAVDGLRRILICRKP